MKISIDTVKDFFYFKITISIREINLIYGW